MIELRQKESTKVQRGVIKIVKSNFGSLHRDKDGTQNAKVKSMKNTKRTRRDTKEPEEGSAASENMTL